jgi:hypothetical protein
MDKDIVIAKWRKYVHAFFEIKEGTNIGIS